MIEFLSTFITFLTEKVLPVPYIDSNSLSALQIKLIVTDPVHGESRIPSALAKAIASPFDLTTGPMVKVTLMPLQGKPEHLLVISMHYAVTDGWSAGILFKDISLAYNALKLGKGKLSFNPSVSNSNTALLCFLPSWAVSSCQ